MEFSQWDYDPARSRDSCRPLGLFDPCPCGCDNRGGKIKGYLLASQPPFGGFTITAKTDAEWRLLQRILHVLGARRVLASNREEYGLPEDV